MQSIQLQMAAMHDRRKKSQEHFTYVITKLSNNKEAIGAATFYWIKYVQHTLWQASTIHELMKLYVLLSIDAEDIFRSEEEIDWVDLFYKSTQILLGTKQVCLKQYKYFFTQEKYYDLKIQTLESLIGAIEGNQHEIVKFEKMFLNIKNKHKTIN